MLCSPVAISFKFIPSITEGGVGLTRLREDPDVTCQGKMTLTRLTKAPPQGYRSSKRLAWDDTLLNQNTAKESLLRILYWRQSGSFYNRWTYRQGSNNTIWITMTLRTSTIIILLLFICLLRKAMTCAKTLWRTIRKSYYLHYWREKAIGIIHINKTSSKAYGERVHWYGYMWLNFLLNNCV